MNSSSKFFDAEKGDTMGNVKEQSVLNAFDFSAIDEMDPSLAEGHTVVFDREAPFELRIQDPNSGPQEVGTLEAIRVKILQLVSNPRYEQLTLLQGEQNNLQNVKIELTSENDLFFHYTHIVDEDSFRHMQENQKLMIEFTDYINILIKMVNSCIKEPHSFLAVFIMSRDGSAKLDFIQNIEYKFIELLSCDFMASPEDTVRQSITFRYNSVKSKVALMEARLKDVNNLVKIKNPSLLL